MEHDNSVAFHSGSFIFGDRLLDWMIGWTLVNGNKRPFRRHCESSYTKMLNAGLGITAHVARFTQKG